MAVFKIQTHVKGFLSKWFKDKKKIAHISLVRQLMTSILLGNSGTLVIFLKKILKWRMEQEIIRTDQELARIGGINYSIYKIYKFSYF